MSLLQEQWKQHPAIFLGVIKIVIKSGVFYKIAKKKEEKLMMEALITLVTNM